jgi:hypothetical protein
VQTHLCMRPTCQQPTGQSPLAPERGQNLQSRKIESDSQAASGNWLPSYPCSHWVRGVAAWKSQATRLGQDARTKYMRRKKKE